MITNSTLWQHRRVESLHLNDGPTSRRRVSLDITIPGDERLEVVSGAPGAEKILFIPLALIQKARLQDFDSSYDGSKPLPIAGAEMNGHASVEAVVAAWRLEYGTPPTLDERAVISEIVFGKADAETDRRVTAFLDGEPWEGTRVSVDARTAPQTVVLLENLSKNFILAGLFPPETAGARHIVKYSTHWELVGAARDQKYPWWRWFSSAVGLSSAPLDIPLNTGIIGARSSHLEIHTPRGIISQSLSAQRDGVPVEIDSRPGVVAHIAFPQGADVSPDIAVVHLRTSPYGLLPWVAVASGASAVIFWAGRLSGYADRAFLPGMTSATPIFLAAIALLLGFLSREQENPVAGRVLRPLRLSIATLAMLYFALAAASAMGADAHLGSTVWWVATVFASGLCAATSLGLLQCRRLTLDSDGATL
jgi:hypothetical protein